MNENLHNFMMKSCSDVQTFLMDYQDKQLPLRDMVRFRLHLAVCRGCKKYLLKYNSGVKLAQHYLQDPPPQDLVDMTLKFLDGEASKMPTDKG